MTNSEKFDQYYTKGAISEECCKKLKEMFPKCYLQTFLEPSAGTGSFVDAIYAVFGDVNLKVYDIEPKREDIIQSDFTAWTYVRYR